MPHNRIAALLADRAPIGHHKPWPRHEVDAATWEAVGQALANGATLLGFWGDVDAVHAAVRAPALDAPRIVSLPVRGGVFPSLGRHHAPAIRL